MATCSTASLPEQAIIIFDIETVPLDGRLEDMAQLLSPPDGNDVEPPEPFTVDELKSFLKESRPARHVLQKMLATEAAGKGRTGAIDALQAAVKKYAGEVPSKYAVLPEFQRIVCIGMEDTRAGQSCVIYDDNPGPGSEARLLEEFWKRIDHGVLCGWNVGGFDIPCLLLASQRCGVTPSQYFDIRRGTGFVDLMRARFGNTLMGLQVVAGALGMANEVQALDPFRSGADVLPAWNEGRIEDIITHCSIDVARTSFIYDAYKGLFV